jgi:hypothetical protein
VGGAPGLYLTLAQSATITPITQGAIFAFSQRR